METILIFGAGVIGSTYGCLIAKSGYQVTMVARNNRLDELRSNGLYLKRVNQKFPERVDVQVVDETQLQGSFDYVIVALRSDQVMAALPTLSKITSRCFVFMVNNASGYDEWIEVLGVDRVLPAFPGAGGKIENGIVHYEIVSKLIQPTTLGELSGQITPRLKELGQILKISGFQVAFSKNMDTWQKSHVAMVAPMAFVIYYDGGNNYSASRSKDAVRQMNLALKECFSFLKRSGIGIEPYKLHVFLCLPQFMLNIIMKFVYNTRWAETVISNHALAAREEMEKICNDFLKLAHSKGYDLKEFKKLTNR